CRRIPAFFHALDSRKQCVTFIEDELKEQPAPGWMVLQTIVKFRRQRAELGQIVPWNRRQIVVFIVITHVETNPIDRPVITIRLLFGIVCVMLLNPARDYQMKPDRKEKRKDEVQQAGPAAKVDHTNVIQDRDDQIQRKPSVP